MIMMVLNKNKLKKILIFLLIILFIGGGIVFTIKKNESIPSINILDLAKAPYTQGTKKNSGYVALTCNVDLGWETEYVQGILDVLKKEDVKRLFKYCKAKGYFCKISKKVSLFEKGKKN